ncbi:CdaR family protein [Aneurinibacillus sp. Ricciae_BoGa-3]|uniref:CdaR family protein n=1 Tax=Aneurinibacillus sp. Ricciae_BoGa-3 TaxID=3022697 RepID=UPI002340FD89|nr:CdaR family protein [Aneurinibacillus sp. Ricciae_BoGa-3]WCK54807.1 CdaR family protein [Aneurinibacillus sp. Ricciae_BoGa-3]
MDRWLNNNTVVKILSVIIAIMLWMVVNNDRPQTSLPGVSGSSSHLVTQTTDMELSVRYDEKKYVVKAPAKVQVEIKGSPEQLALFSIMSGKSDVYIDLHNYGTGSYTVPVQPEGFPAGLQVAITPATVPVTVEAIANVTKNVRVSVVGKAQNGLIVGQPSIYPQQVTVQVAESRVSDVGFVQAVVSVEDASTDIATHATLRVLDKHGQPIEAKVYPERVDVKIPLTTSYKSVPVKVATKGNPPAGYAIQSINVIPAQIKVYGSPDTLNQMDSYSTAPIDVSGLTGSQTLQVSLPPDRSVTKIDPKVVEVTVEVAPPPTGVKNEGSPAANAPPSPTLKKAVLTCPSRSSGLPVMWMYKLCSQIPAR